MEENIDDIYSDLRSDTPGRRRKGRRKYAETFDEPEIDFEDYISDSDLGTIVSGQVSAKKAIINTVEPVLFELGFEGRYPYYCRISDDQLQLVDFQMSKWGGEFFVNLGAYQMGDWTLPKEELSTGRITVPNLWWLYRSRLLVRKPKLFTLFSVDSGDVRFKFDENNLKEVCLLVVSLLKSQAEEWWNSRRPWHKRLFRKIGLTGGSHKWR